MDPPHVTPQRTHITPERFGIYFWCGIAAFVAVVSLSNILVGLICQRTIPAHSTGRWNVKKAGSSFAGAIISVARFCRRLRYVDLALPRSPSWLKFPSSCTLSILLAYFSFLLALEFIDNSTAGIQNQEALGNRAACLATAQIPLVILLAGKHSIIGFLTSQSYERLNIYHRWVARGLLLLASIHFLDHEQAWMAKNILQVVFRTSKQAQSGMAAWALLLWMNVSTFLPLRRWNYEIFVVQHIITFCGLIVAIMMHLPPTALHSRVYVYIAIVLYTLDRVVRAMRTAYHNFTSGQATLTKSHDEGDMTKVVVRGVNLKSWKPGSFVLLSVPKFGLVQSHPATIASTPSSHGGDLVFLLRSHKGFTNRLLKAATLYHESINVSTPITPTTPLLPQCHHTDVDIEEANEQSDTNPKSYLARIDGPYGACSTDFTFFDSVLLIAGGTGITFCIALLLDVAARAPYHPLPLRTIRLIWAVKTLQSSTSLVPELQTAVIALRSAGIDANVDIHVTQLADEEDTAAQGEGNAPRISLDFGQLSLSQSISEYSFGTSVTSSNDQEDDDLKFKSDFSSPYTTTGSAPLSENPVHIMTDSYFPCTTTFPHDLSNPAKISNSSNRLSIFSLPRPASAASSLYSPHPSSSITTPLPLYQPSPHHLHPAYRHNHLPTVFSPSPFPSPSPSQSSSPLPSPTPSLPPYRRSSINPNGNRNRSTSITNTRSNSPIPLLPLRNPHRQPNASIPYQTPHQHQRQNHLTYHRSRPRIPSLLQSAITASTTGATGTGVAVCGPLSLASSVRKAIWDAEFGSGDSDDNEVTHGDGAQKGGGVYLHIEEFDM